MIKSCFLIIGTLALLSPSLMAGSGRGPDDPSDNSGKKSSCAPFLRTVSNNSARLNHPDIKRLFSQESLKVIFDNLTRAQYPESRHFSTTLIEPRYVTNIYGDAADSAVFLSTVLKTAAGGPDFRRKADFIPSSAEAEFQIVLDAASVTGLMSSVGSTSALASRKPPALLPGLAEGNPREVRFVSRLFLENFLTERDLLNVLGETSAHFQSRNLANRERLGTWKIFATRAELSLRLDSLSFAEFSALMNLIAVRIEQRASSHVRTRNRGPEIR